jgi:hypothetical protein
LGLAKEGGSDAALFCQDLINQSLLERVNTRFAFVSCARDFGAPAHWMRYLICLRFDFVLSTKEVSMSKEFAEKGGVDDADGSKVAAKLFGDEVWSKQSVKQVPLESPRRQPDTPIDQPRRTPDAISDYGDSKFETWNYPDGTSERRYTARGGYCSLTRFDERGRQQEEFTVGSGNSHLEISRPDGTETHYYSGRFPFRATYAADGTYRSEDLPRNQVDTLMRNYRRIIMR